MPRRAADRAPHVHVVHHPRDRLRAEDLRWSEATPRAEGPAVYGLDPDGHEFEIVQYRPGYVYA